MKKILLIFVLLVLLAPIAQAATVFSENFTTFQLNETKTLWPVIITATAANEITAKNGISLFMEPDSETLWDTDVSLAFSGSAVTGGKISATAVPEFKNKYQVIHIPVLADFAANESITIGGLRLRAYRHSFTTKFIQMDMTGDGIADAQDVQKIEILNTYATDFTPPYPPTDYAAIVSPDLKSVKLNWVYSPDYDQLGITLDRKRVRSGFTQSTNVLSNVAIFSYADTDILPNDKITYTIYTSDGRNNSQAISQTVEIKAIQAQSEVMQPSEESVVPSAIPNLSVEQADELAQITKLFGYYKTRQAIKCREGVLANDSACLWAKIDFIYSQALLGRSDVNISLSARDLELIRLRIVWPERRYQGKCVGDQTPDKTCPALEKSIKRAHYFID